MKWLLKKWAKLNVRTTIGAAIILGGLGLCGTFFLGGSNIMSALITSKDRQQSSPNQLAKVESSPGAQVIQEYIDVQGNYIHNETPATLPLKILDPQAEHLLKAIYDHQARYAASKLVISRHGTILFVEPGQMKVDVDIAAQIWPNQELAVRSRQFEVLMEEMPSQYLKMFPEARFDNPFVVAVTEAGVDYLKR